MKSLTEDKNINQHSYFVSCILVGHRNKEYASYNIIAYDEDDARKKLKEHIKQTYPPDVAYKWEFLSLNIRKCADKTCSEWDNLKN